MSATIPLPFEIRLRQIRFEAEDILSYEFVAKDGQSLPAFTAGAHIDLHLPGEIIRSYSLMNDPADAQRYVIGVQRSADSRGGSSWMHDAPRAGDLFRISGPINDFSLCEYGAETIFIAGGIGITPLLSMAKRLNRIGRPWQLFYGVRSLEQAAFIPQILKIASPGRPPVICFESAGGGRLDINKIVKEASANAHFYCCGPTGMLDAFLSAASERPAAHIHYERFSASSEAAVAGGYEIVLNRSGKRIEVSPGKTILDVLLDNDVSVQYACSEGVCGTCRTSVLEGIPDHRDDYLSAEEKQENRSIMVCCSGSKSKSLVLDL